MESEPQNPEFRSNPENLSLDKIIINRRSIHNLHNTVF